MYPSVFRSYGAGFKTSRGFYKYLAPTELPTTVRFRLRNLSFDFVDQMSAT